MVITADLTYASLEDHILKQKLIRAIEHISGKPKIEELYEKIDECHAGKASFFSEALRMLQVTVDHEPKQIDKIPQSGPLVFLANHPFGVLDGLFLSFLGASSRKNWGILLYDKFCEVEHMEGHFLPISFDETKEAMKVNIKTRRQALSLLKEDGAIVIFPAGGISTADGFLGPVSDHEWKLFAAKLVQVSKATVVPVYFHGYNSHLFHTVSQFSMTLRLALIIHELRNKIGKSIQVTIGDPLPYEALAHIKKRQLLIEHLRQHVYSLGATESPELRVKPVYSFSAY